MTIVDAQVHIWSGGTPGNRRHRQIPAFTKDDLLKEMAVAGVDAAVIHPPTSWDPDANALAIEVSPNDPAKMFTLDDVDWNQIPPDNNTGIQFPVQLQVDGALSDTNARVAENNAAEIGRAHV